MWEVVPMFREHGNPMVRSRTRCRSGFACLTGAPPPRSAGRTRPPAGRCLGGLERSGKEPDEHEPPRSEPVADRRAAASGRRRVRPWLFPCRHRRAPAPPTRRAGVLVGSAGPRGRSRPVGVNCAIDVSVAAGTAGQVALGWGMVVHRRRPTERSGLPPCRRFRKRLWSSSHPIVWWAIPKYWESQRRDRRPLGGAIP